MMHDRNLKLCAGFALLIIALVAWKWLKIDGLIAIFIGLAGIGLINSAFN